MACNPQLDGNRVPALMEGEALALHRRGISFTAKSGSTKVSGSGDLYVSTLRLVFVASRAGAGLAAFDVPLATLAEESFNQPIFGANNLTGTSPPLDVGEGTLPGTIKWCFAFTEGGVGTFLHFFFTLLQEMRRRMRHERRKLPAYMLTPTTYYKRS